MAVPVFDFSCLELPMVASKEASANVANFYSYFPPVMPSPSAQETSVQTQGRVANLLRMRYPRYGTEPFSLSSLAVAKAQKWLSL